MIYLETITSVILLLLMAYLSYIKTVFLTCSDKGIKEKIKDNEKTLNKYKEIEKKQSLAIACIKSSISFCSMWFGALVVEIVAMPIYREISITRLRYNYTIKYLLILATVIVLTYIMYIVVDTLPKAFAIKRKNKSAIYVIDDIYLLLKMFKPVMTFCSMTEKIIVRIFNINKEQEIEYNDSEIKEIVEIAKEEGSINDKDEKVLSNYIGLDLKEAKDIMLDISKACMIDINDTKNDIKNKILDSGYSRLPVYDGDSRNIIGILNTKKLLNSALIKDTFKIENLVKPCLYVPRGKRLDLLFDEMKKKKQHMVIVTKEKNIALGIVTMEDIIEEVFGNIEDEKDQEKNGN